MLNVTVPAAAVGLPFAPLADDLTVADLVRIYEGIQALVTVVTGAHYEASSKGLEGAQNELSAISEALCDRAGAVVARLEACQPTTRRDAEERATLLVGYQVLCGESTLHVAALAAQLAAEIDLTTLPH